MGPSGSGAGRFRNGREDVGSAEVAVPIEHVDPPLACGALPPVDHDAARDARGAAADQFRPLDLESLGDGECNGGRLAEACGPVEERLPSNERGEPRLTLGRELPLSAERVGALNLAERLAPFVRVLDAVRRSDDVSGAVAWSTGAASEGGEDGEGEEAPGGERTFSQRAALVPCHVTLPQRTSLRTERRA